MPAGSPALDGRLPRRRSPARARRHRVRRWNQLQESTECRASIHGEERSHTLHRAAAASDPERTVGSGFCSVQPRTEPTGHTCPPVVDPHGRRRARGCRRVAAASFAGGGDFRSERQEAVTPASDFAVTFNTYSVDKKADYQRRVKALMTPSYYKEFAKITDAMFGAIEDKKQSSGDAKVLATAVDSIDEDSAVVLVAVNASVKSTRQKTAVERRFRWTVTLGRYQGEWRVREFDAVPRSGARSVSRRRAPHDRRRPVSTPAAAAPPPHRGRVEAGHPRPRSSSGGKVAIEAAAPRRQRRRSPSQAGRPALRNRRRRARPRPRRRARVAHPPPSACRPCPDGSAPWSP